MKETERLVKSFEDLYHGNPWLDVTIMGTLENLTGVQASNRVFANRNTIWEIVNHLIAWRLNVLQRIQGNSIITPENNYISEIRDSSEVAWKNTIEQLKESQRKWINFLRTFDENNFELIYPANGMTYYEHIQGILQHDAYHLGQIKLLAKSA
jgi:uncharacterized damage-inducible protein DinB